MPFRAHMYTYICRCNNAELLFPKKRELNSQEQNIMHSRSFNHSSCVTVQEMSCLTVVPDSPKTQMLPNPHEHIVHDTYSGLSQAAQSQRSTAYCKDLNAYIAIPAVPPKYLRWLRQRRAATKEIRNMMRIGRHKNVVHLYEVLELIQDSKSTMFLILELVRGGELFDLISSNASSPTNLSKMMSNSADGAEVLMLKFFKELVSGICYCHANGIAHRDLKLENILLRTKDDGV